MENTERPSEVGEVHRSSRPGPHKHPEEILNIVTGQYGNSSVNVQDAVAIGESQMREFCQKLPNGSNETIHKEVVTMLAMKKHVNVADTKVYDTNVIYSRVIGLQASGREVYVKAVLSHELAPVPTSLFGATGDMRAAT